MNIIINQSSKKIFHISSCQENDSTCTMKTARNLVMPLCSDTRESEAAINITVFISMPSVGLFYSLSMSMADAPPPPLQIPAIPFWPGFRLWTM